MRDVSNKIKTQRTAEAEAVLVVNPETIAKINAGEIPKGDPLPIAKVAAIQAAKETSRIIPYCHPIPVDHVDVNFELADDRITIRVRVKAIHKTGVEMEALTAASVAALTIYDMTKMLDERMEITSVRLLKKKGGKNDFRDAFDTPPRAAVLVMSDSIAAGEKDDHSGRIIEQRLRELNIDVTEYKIIPDEHAEIEQNLKRYADEEQLDLVLTTGGTGFSPRDITPEAMDAVLEREAPGIAETARAYGQERMPFAMLSRGRAGLRGHTLIVNLPGSRGGVTESLDALLPHMLHCLKIMRGVGHANDPRKKLKK